MGPTSGMGVNNVMYKFAFIYYIITFIYYLYHLHDLGDVGERYTESGMWEVCARFSDILWNPAHKDK